MFEHCAYMHAFVHMHTNMHTYVESMTHSEEANVFEHRAHGPRQLSHPLKVATVSAQPPIFCTGACMCIHGWRGEGVGGG